MQSHFPKPSTRYRVDVWPTHAMPGNRLPFLAFCPQHCKIRELERSRELFCCYKATLLRKQTSVIVRCYCPVPPKREGSAILCGWSHNY